MLNYCQIVLFIIGIFPIQTQFQYVNPLNQYQQFLYNRNLKAQAQFLKRNLPYPQLGWGEQPQFPYSPSQWYEQSRLWQYPQTGFPQHPHLRHWQHQILRNQQLQLQQRLWQQQLYAQQVQSYQVYGQMVLKYLLKNNLLQAEATTEKSTTTEPDIASSGDGPTNSDPDPDPQKNPIKRWIGDENDEVLIEI